MQMKLRFVINYKLSNSDTGENEVIRMGFADIAVLFLVASAAAGVIVYLRKQKKAGKSCCSGCVGCSGCCSMRTGERMKEEL